MKAFTLIELLIVLIIIGVVTAIAIPKYQDYKEKAYDAEAFTAFTNIKHGEEEYRASCGSYLSADLSTPDNWAALGLKEFYELFSQQNEVYKFAYAIMAWHTEGFSPEYRIIAERKKVDAQGQHLRYIHYLSNTNEIIYATGP